VHDSEGVGKGYRDSAKRLVLEAPDDHPVIASDDPSTVH
jgi:hypothetical protein